MRDHDIIGTDPTRAEPDFGLFAQRAAAPDVADEVRPVVRAAMRGGRETALKRIAPHLSGLRGRVYQGIIAHGPITRDALAATLGMGENTVNGRCAELLKAKLVRIAGYDTTTGRGKLAVVPPTTEE